MSDGRSLKADAFLGVKWTTLSSLTAIIAKFLQIAILARYLTPEDFGLVGIVMVVVGFAQVFTDAGMSAAIVQRQNITNNQLSSLYWLNIFSGIAVFCAVWAVAPVAASFFKEETLKDLFRLSAATFLIIPFGQQFQFLLQKELKFDTISKIDVASTLFGAALSIALAIFGFGASSIILGALFSALIKSLSLLSKGILMYMPRLYFKYSDIKDFLSFGLYQMGEKSLNYFASRVDQLIIGKYLGSEQLGYYNIAFNLVIQPVSRINPIINRVAFPLYAQVQNDNERLKRGFLQTTRYLTLINFPLLAGLAAVANPFVSTVYGPQWAPCAPIIQILAFIGILRSRGNPIGSLVIAKGRADLSFKWVLFVAIASAAMLLIVVKHGIIATAFSLAIFGAITFVLGYFVLTRPLIGKCSKGIFVDTFLIPLTYSILMAFPVSFIASNVSLADPLLLAICVIFGALLYAVLMMIFEKRTITEIFNHLKNKSKKH